MNSETTCPLRVYALIALLEFACTSKKCWRKQTLMSSTKK